MRVNRQISYFRWSARSRASSREQKRSANAPRFALEKKASATNRSAARAQPLPVAASLRRDFLPQDRPTRAVRRKVEAAMLIRMAVRNWRVPRRAGSELPAPCCPRSDFGAKPRAQAVRRELRERF